VIVVEFVGNNLTPCMSGYTTTAQISAKYAALTNVVGNYS
jgi:hypothetical protein